jgi:hypothetical protein
MDGDGGAGDGNFDACECIYNHNAGMQRLINFVSFGQDGRVPSIDCLIE